MIFQSNLLEVVYPISCSGRTYLVLPHFVWQQFSVSCVYWVLTIPWVYLVDSGSEKLIDWVLSSASSLVTYEIGVK